VKIYSGEHRSFPFAGLLCTIVGYLAGFGLPVNTPIAIEVYASCIVAPVPEIYAVGIDEREDQDVKFLPKGMGQIVVFEYSFYKMLHAMVARYFRWVLAGEDEEDGFVFEVAAFADVYDVQGLF